jgi:hypothetical protein
MLILYGAAYRSGMLREPYALSSLACRRPEDIKDARPVAICDASAPGSDVAAAMSAALAAAALVFKQSDPGYAAKCLKSARNMYR